MGEDFEGCTFYVLSTHKIDVFPQSASIPGEKKVLLFMSDELSSIPWHLRSSYFAIFKSYLPKEVPGTNIFPFHLGYGKGVPSFEPKPVDERSIDLFFSGNLNANRTPCSGPFIPSSARSLVSFQIALSRSSSERSSWGG
jgi:hypothetical protein